MLIESNKGKGDAMPKEKILASIGTVRAYLATPAGVRRLHGLMFGRGVGYTAAVAVIASDVLGDMRAKDLEKIALALVSEIPRLAA